MGFYTVVTFVHILAACTWVGGMIYLNLVFLPALGTIEPSAAGKLMGENAKRFSMLAWVSVILLIITGLMQTTSGLLFDISTDYGMYLTIKVLIVMIMITIGLYITLVLAPKIRKLAPQEGAAPSPEFLSLQKRLPLLARTNMILGISVLFLISIIS